MERKVHLENLFVEITRRCNMSCMHCMRGNIQNKDMDFKIIDTILENVNYIGSVTFTGGEPSLNIEAMRYFREEAIKKEIPIASFCVITNGKENALELAQECLLLNSYTLEFDNDATCFSALLLSYDKYHQKIDKLNENILRGLTFFSEERMYINGKEFRIANEGKAKKNNIGETVRYVEDVSIVDWEKDCIYVDSMTYINVNGDVIPGCDFSYETQEKIKMGNIMDEDLYGILEKGASQKVS